MNPWFNLATEDWIFRELDPSTHVLFLWRNSDTVVIGRHQNPWTECNIQKMEEDNIYLARRQSGGGAVFHDLGNTNFTFLSGKDKYNQDVNFSIIINALAVFGIKAEKSGRNDILVNGRKVSGSAFKQNIDRSFHHGTLLLGADLTRLSNYLNPSKKKLISKGVKSVRSRVANLSELVPEINHELVCDAIKEAFFKQWGSRCEIEILDAEVLKKIPSLKSYYDKMADWEWRFGKTPEFSHTLKTRFEWGEIELHLNVKSSIIQDVRIYSDSLYLDLIEQWERLLPESAYDPGALSAVLDTQALKEPDRSKEIGEFRDWLKDSL